METAESKQDTAFNCQCIWNLITAVPLVWMWGNEWLYSDNGVAEHCTQGYSPNYS